MSIEFSYKLTENDYIEYNKYFVYNSSFSRKNMMMGRFMMPAMMLLAVLIMWLLDSELFTSFAIVGGVVSVGWIVFFRRINDRGIMSNVRKLKKAGRLTDGREVSYKFDPAGYTLRTSDGELRMGYGTFERVGVGEHGVYLFQTANVANIIPNRVFADTAQRDAFVKFATDRIGKKQS